MEGKAPFIIGTGDYGVPDGSEYCYVELLGLP